MFQVVYKKSDYNKALMTISFKIAHMVAKTKKPFTIAEKFIVPCLSIVAKELFDKEAEEKFKNIPLSDNSMMMM